MPSLIVLLVVGFLAQLIDGSLGMAYGVTSSTLLLSIGLTPAVASASVHFAEVGTTALVLTKLDEATALGNVLPVLRSSKLPLSYLI